MKSDKVKRFSKTVRLPEHYIDLINAFPGNSFTARLINLINMTVDLLDDKEKEEVPFT